jgi:hypothetical protein
MLNRFSATALRYGIYLTGLLLLAACSRPKNCKTPEELGKTVFELFQQQETGKLKQYLISEPEIKTAFESSPQYVSLTEEEKKIFVNSTYTRNKEIGENWIDFYTGGDKATSKIVKEGKWESTTAEKRQDNGTAVAKIVVLFKSEDKLHELNLNAALVKDYWKLLSWIEVK